MVSQDDTVAVRTKQQSVMGKYMMVCSDTVGENNVLSMRPEYPASALYTQLKYYESMFDLKRARRKVEAENGKRSAANARAAGAASGPAASLPLLNANVVQEKGEEASEMNTIRDLASTIVQRSEYSWVGTEIWRTAFGGSRSGRQQQQQQASGKPIAMGMRAGRARVYA